MKGRPTDNPKNKDLKIRITQDDEDKIRYCIEKTNKNKSEIVRDGIDMVYKSIKK